ncbi:D-amino acid dehydrogenase [Saccharolobus shibatae B12]|uniref:D-amino acid dehydrogenase n=1 Tax=Saccharolobus shibatae (strain ATCC 51178 / DSM 5389 / JCM 8931 / NBRC 15437 / B12) TaxID=523848 RepID=A0A8F5BQT1_SACSH|nr:FAD-dependent oxidoreductase [Saccharolobus shibatae]QXJ29620.1 D-amino acid dehydrogenase [Saccharolobus shibatae B12]
MKVGIVGGGIVGLFTAYYLGKEGIRDIIIYEKGFLGAGSIHAAGLIEPYRFDKINTLSMIKKMLKYKMNGSTDIKEVDKLWLIELIKNLEKDPPKEAWDTMREMAKFSLSEYKRMAEEKNDFDYHEDGLLELYHNSKEFENGIEDEKKSPFSPKFEVEEVKGFAGGLFFPELSRISTEKFVDRISREITDNIKVRNEEVNKVSEEGYIGEEKYDLVIVAAGVWSRILKIPLTAFKGYGYRVKGVSKLNRAAVIVDYGLAISPLSDHIKITGGFDADFSIHSKRAEEFLKRAEELVDIQYINDLNMGFRPCSPDGFPIIGRRNNLVLVTGACRLGWSYGPAMGRYAADLALDKVKDLGYISRYYHE